MAGIKPATKNIFNLSYLEILPGTTTPPFKFFL